MRWLGVVVVVVGISGCGPDTKADAACCGCLARHVEEDTVTPCVPDEGECTAALENRKPVHVSDFCLKQCPEECANLQQS